MVKVTKSFSVPEQAAFSGRAAPTVVTSSWTISRCRRGADRRMQTFLRALEQKSDGFLIAGPPESPSSYESIDSQPMNRAIMSLFRRKMVKSIGHDSEAQGYDAIVDLTRSLNRMSEVPRDTQERTRLILLSLFPAWLPPAFRVMFSKPLPALSCRLNAWVTMLTCQWLMGPCKVNDVELGNGTVAKAQGVLVERCRYLEESGCVSVCLNSCKVPTQEFFEKDMGLPLTMTPNYEDFSCQFSFGLSPKPQAEDDAFRTPCFAQCPSKRKHSGTDLCPGVTAV